MIGRAPSKRAVLIAGPTASGKSALALAWRKSSAARSSMPIPCRSTAICASSPRVRRRRRRRACPICSTAMSTPPRTIRSAAGASMRAPRWRRSERAGRLADRGRRHRALFQGADARACRRPADPGRHPLSGQRAGSRARASRALCRAQRPRPGDRAPPDAGRSRPHHPRARGRLGDRPFAHRLAPGRHGACARPPTPRSRSFSMSSAPSSTAASMRASMPCWRPARSTRCARSAAAVSTPRSRP